MYLLGENKGLAANRLRKISQIENWHFWFIGRQALVDKLVNQFLKSKNKILDIGCGTGHWVERMNRKGFHTVGLDIQPEGLSITRQSQPEAHLLQADAIRLPIRDAIFDGVFMLDILEHVNDHELLREVHRILKPGGFAILSVPAHPHMWSFRDVAAGHLRRYTRISLDIAISNADLTVLKINYYQFILLPLVVLSRLLGRKGPFMRDREDEPAAMLNTIFSKINRFEAGISDKLPNGTSLIAICRKP